MDWHALAIRAVIGPLWACWERSPYLRHYRQLRRNEFDAPEAVQSRQWELLRAIVAHAHGTVPYYRRRLAEAGIRPADLRTWDDYRRVPVLTKADIRAHGDELISDRYPRSTLHRKRTSGSTGVALEVWVDEAAMQWKRGCTLRTDEWSGWRFGGRTALLWGNPEYLKRGWRGRFRNTVLERGTYLDTLKIDDQALARFAAELRRRPPDLILGHAHSIYLLAEYLRDHGPAGFRPRGIISTAMVLHDWQRRAIEAVFGCAVTNRYGCEEVSLIASECERHDGLHVNADGVYVEVEHDGRPAAPGEPGSLIVTDLRNRGMPILRYKIGDVAVRTDRVCPCGRGLPLLERLEGREADYVVTPSGKLISGISLTDHFGTKVAGIAQLQIVQEALDRLRFRIVRGPEFGPESLEHLGGLVAERFGPGVRYECEYVDRIPQEPSGKYRFCVSRVENPFTRARPEAAAAAEAVR